MNTRLIKQTFSFLGCTFVLFGVSTLKAQAQTKSAPEIVQNRTNQAADLQAQTETAPAGIAPGRATRGGSSYIGIGGNIGISGETTLSEGAFAVISKVGLTNNLSVRPSAVIGDSTVFLVPVTVDFPVAGVTETGTTQISAAPYFGGGVAVSTADDSNVGVLLTGGVDVPVANQVTGNASVNVSFLDDTNIGVLLGVGYNF
jgi:hypothetical protein